MEEAGLESEETFYQVLIDKFGVGAGSGGSGTGIRRIWRATSTDRTDPGHRLGFGTGTEYGPGFSRISKKSPYIKSRAKCEMATNAETTHSRLNRG